MTLRKIAAMGHPVLWAPAEPVPLPLDAEIQRLIDDMIDTMRDAPGVGLAAPQVYVSLRLIVLQRSREQDAPEVLINPVLETVGDDRNLGIEGCLSIPGWQAIVPRWTTVRYRALDRDAGVVRGEATGFHARVLQHEIDHLDGILYPMRLQDPRDMAMTREARHLAERLRAHASAPNEDNAA